MIPAKIALADSKSDSDRAIQGLIDIQRYYGSVDFLQIQNAIDLIIKLNSQIKIMHDEMEKILTKVVDKEFLCVLYNELYYFNKKENPERNAHDIPYMKNLDYIISGKDQ